MWSRLVKLLPRLWSNWISLFGTTLTTVSGNAILIIAVVDIVTEGANQYAAAVGYLLLPPVFLLGLALIAVGAYRDHRRKKDRPENPLDQALDLVMKDTSSRRRVFFVLLATFANVTIISAVAFKAITYMDSPKFCGELCHTIMEPEHTAYLRSPHARVPCVDCHIGEGASWFVRSKLSGLRQVVATATGSFSRPVPTPIHHLRPARETCEKCHWTARFHGTRLLVHETFASDEKNTQKTTVVRLKVGGINRRTGRYEGIHWHVGPDSRIEYEALDPKRRAIGRVTLVEKGRTLTFLPQKGAGQTVLERRVMDCVDCHNRPTHIYDPSPEIAVDHLLSASRLDPSLPFLRRESVSLLKRKIEDPSSADDLFEKGLASFYGSKLSKDELGRRRGAIRGAAKELAQSYRFNNYPRLRITWGTYPSHLGHRQTAEGCFRCHDDAHKTKDGKVIPQDCDLCHDVLAEEDEKPDVPKEVLELGHP
jgi:hypothetical protein